MKLAPERGSARSGFTLPELMMSAVILLLVVGCLTQALRSMSGSATYTSVDSELQAQAERALRAIIASLKPSGFATVGGNSFPYLFQDGNALGAYAASAHAAPTHTAQAGDADFGPDQEIVFVAPADADNDGRPDLDANGQMIWSANQHSYVVVTRPDGVNVLQQRTDGGSIRNIATHVERVRFDDNASSLFEVPLRAIRVRLWLRERDEKGTLHHYFTEAVVKLRNG
jgi:prepilin-type N-terminal cleavage/methylation domain-containing protein